MATGRKKDSLLYIIIAITIFILIAVVLSVYIFNFGWSLAKDIPSKDGVSLIKDSHAVFGQFGDYVGGILNPILTAINIFLLIKFSSRNIEFNNKNIEFNDKTSNLNEKLIRSSEKYHARSEDKEQIFRLIENHQHILRSLRFTQKIQENGEEVSKDHYGINTFWYFRQMVQNRYLSRENQGDTDVKKLENAYRHIYITDEQRQYLGHYFRNLFHIFKFIEMSAFDDEEKQDYAELVRAQLSYLELHFLFLNCLIEEGKEFRNYVSKFSLLKELPVFSFSPSVEIEQIQINPTIKSWQSSDR